MGKNDIGGILGLLTQEEGEEPFYMVGQRPLDWSIGRPSYGGSPSIGHEHFIRKDGINFGFTSTGEFSEMPSALEEYELTPKYGMKRYDADLLEKARQNWHSMHDAVDDVADEMGLWDEGMPDIHRKYSALGNNCKDYVRWLDNEYDRLLKAAAGGCR